MYPLTCFISLTGGSSISFGHVLWKIKMVSVLLYWINDKKWVFSWKCLKHLPRDLIYYVIEEDPYRNLRKVENSAKKSIKKLWKMFYKNDNHNS